MDKKSIFDIFFNDEFTRDFTIGRDSETRSSVALINSYMMMYDSEESKKWTPEMRREFSKNVKKQCCHILKSSELQSQIFDIAFCKELPVKLMDMRAFFDNFADCVQRSLEGICTVELKSGGELCAVSNQKLLNFIMLLYIRSAVLDGAVNIEISYAAKENDLVIEVKITKKNASLKNQYPNDDFFAKYQSGLNDAFVKKLGGKIRELKNSIKMTFSDAISEKKLDIIMKEAPMELSMGLLNPYNIMLSDISDNLI